MSRFARGNIRMNLADMQVSDNWTAKKCVAIRIIFSLAGQVQEALSNGVRPAEQVIEEVLMK